MRAIAICLLTALSLWLPLRLAAVGFEPLSIEALTAQADLILEGKILSKTSARDGTGRIYTKVELDVADVWKGTISGTPFIIVLGGGVLGDQESVVAGQVHYEIGEEVVAFLVRNSRGQGVTVGLMQGKFSVWRDPASPAKYVSHPFHGPLGKTSVAVQKAANGRSAIPSLSLTALKQRVRDSLR